MPIALQFIHSVCVWLFVAVDCMTPTVANAKPITTTFGTTYGRNAIVTCQIGYTGNGVSGTIKCNSSGSWAGFTCAGQWQINASQILENTTCLVWLN